VTPPTRPSTRSILSALPFLAVFLGGCALRLYHLGTFSLWWDEVVHVWTSQSGDLIEVVRQVKQGIPPGAGNAGAVPLDYVLLHSYLQLTTPPAPERLEIYFRLPSFVYSCLAMPLMYAFGRRFLDRQLALLATLLLALSTQHVLYAAEARFYSLFVLMTIANLYAFAALAERRDRLVAWAAYGAINVLFFFAGLFSLLVLAVQYAVLGALTLMPMFSARARAREGPRTPGASRREIGALLVTGAVLAGCVAAYLSGTALDLKYRRNPARIGGALALAWDTYWSFSSDSYFLFACLVLLPLPLIFAWRRGRALFAVVLSLTLSLLAVPLIVELARWKHYYFHPRHALFLLPAVVLLSAIALLFLVRALDPTRWLGVGVPRREAWNLALASALVLATQLPTVRDYLAYPERFFARSKKTYDLRGVTVAVRDQVASYGPGDKYLLVVEGNKLANMPLAQYLRWYGLTDRVVLRGTNDPSQTLERARAECARGCVGQRGGIVDRALQSTAPFGLPLDFQRLLGLLEPIGKWPGVVRRIGIATYSRLPGAKPGDGYVARQLRGVQLVELPPST
jgi:hypothetical protein